MKDEELKSKTVSELESEIKRLKVFAGMAIGISLVLTAVTIYGILTK
ncbi:hypothetical protein [Maribacter sp. 2307ULW6-5]